MRVILTDFGVVRFGPQFQGLADLVERDLAKSKRTKARKAADEEICRIESAASLMAKAAFVAGKVCKVTP